MQNHEPTNKFTERTLRCSVVAVKLGVSEATIWRWVSLGQFPKPLALSPGVSGWLESEINSWLEAKAAARIPDEVAA